LGSLGGTIQSVNFPLKKSGRKDLLRGHEGELLVLTKEGEEKGEKLPTRNVPSVQRNRPPSRLPKGRLPGKKRREEPGHARSAFGEGAVSTMPKKREKIWGSKGRRRAPSSSDPRSPCFRGSKVFALPEEEK